MEITLKITENTPSADLMKTAAFLELLAGAPAEQDSCSEWTAEPAPTEDQQACEETSQPKTESAAPVKPKEAKPKEAKPEPEPAASAESEAADPEVIRAQIRTLGGKLTAAGKAGDMLKIFEAHGVRKVKDLKPEDLPAVIKELEAL